MSNTVFESYRQLNSAGLVASASLAGCDQATIQQIEQHQGVLLPTSYKEFLRLLGRDPGDFMNGSQFSCSDLSPNHSAAQILLGEIGESLPDQAIVFLMHQGLNFLFFVCGTGEDPEVFRYLESESPHSLGMSFTEWFQMATADEIELHQS